MKMINKVSVVASVSFALGLMVPMAALAAGPATVNLGTAGNFTILAKTGISSTGTTAIVGDIGVSPAQATYITGNFALDLPASSAFSTSVLVTGKVYAPSYAVPTPAYISTAVSDMETAYTDAAGRASTVTELGAGNIGGLTLVPGVYKWGTGVTIPTDVTLSGSANDVWIFQIAQNLAVSSATKVVLAGGAQASNIFWVVAGQTTIGTTATFQGNILDQTAIVLNTGATLNGRALAQTAVTLDSNAVTIPTAPTTSANNNSNATTASTPASSTGSTSSSQTSSGSTTSSNSASGLSAGQIQSILDVLTSFNVDASMLANVRASLEGTTNGSVTSAAVHVFQSNLTVGSLGSEVKALQVYLNTHGYAIATSGAGSLGNETTKFGAATRAALVKYQKANGIIPASGFFGPLTRIAVNAGK